MQLSGDSQTLVAQALQLTSSVLSLSQDALSTAAAASVMSVVDAVCGAGISTAVTTQVSSPSTGNGSSSSSSTLVSTYTALSGVPTTLLNIVARINMARTEQLAAFTETSNDVSSPHRSVQTTGASSSAWVHDTVSRIGRVVASSLIPGAPSLSLAAGSSSDGSGLSVG